MENFVNDKNAEKNIDNENQYFTIDELSNSFSNILRRINITVVTDKPDVRQLTLKEQLSSKADNLVLQNVENNLSQTIGSVQSIANGAVNSANNAQNTANEADRKAEAAQSTANGAVKNIDFFVVEAAVSTRVKSNDVVFNFPDAVDAVALQTMSNDSNQIIRANLSQLSPTSFNVHIDGVNGDGHHWIPGLKFLGIKVRR